MSKLLDKLKKAGSIKTAEVLSESFFFNAKDMIQTELPILNIAFSGDLDGGLVPGLTIFAGNSKTFKTLSALYCLKAYFDKYPDAICLFYDSEFGVTPDYLKMNGIDADRVIHIPVEHVEQLKFDMVKRLEEIERGDKVFILVDSLGNLASKKEVEDAQDEKSVADMSRAKGIRSLLRIITPHLTMKDLPCIVVNHVYMEMGMFPKTVIPGGCVLAGTKVIMGDGDIKQIENILPGDIIKTLTGTDVVEHIWNPDTLEDGEPECVEIEFEDGYVCTTSLSHKFLVSKSDTFIWVEAKDLTSDMDIVSLN